MGLVDIINKEMKQVVAKAEHSAESLDRSIRFIEVADNKTVKESVVVMIEQIRKATTEYSRLEEQTRFDLETFERLFKTYELLERSLPTPAGLEKIKKIINNNLDGSIVARNYDSSTNERWVIGGISGISAGISITYGCVLPAFLYAYSSFSALLGAPSKDSHLKRLTGDAAMALGAVTLAYSATPSDVPDFIIKWATVLTPLRFTSHLFKSLDYSFSRLSTKLSLATADVSRKKFDEFVRTGVVIQEAYYNLRYLERICQAEKRSKDEFQDQVVALESVLTDYVHGKASFEQVKQAGIRYIPRKTTQTIRKEIPKLEPVKKNGYTPEEYERLKQKRLQEEQQDVMIQQTMEVPVQLQKQTLPAVNFSPELMGGYSSKQRLGGYLLGPIMDLTREKIENSKNGEVIRDSQSAQNMLRRLRAKHGLEQGVTVFKMCPTGSLRALYTRNNGSVEVLEIFTHQEYDKRMKR